MAHVYSLHVHSELRKDTITFWRAYRGCLFTFHGKSGRENPEHPRSHSKTRSGQTTLTSDTTSWVNWFLIYYVEYWSCHKINIIFITMSFFLCNFDWFLIRYLIHITRGITKRNLTNNIIVLTIMSSQNVSNYLLIFF